MSFPLESSKENLILSTLQLLSNNLEPLGAPVEVVLSSIAKPLAAPVRESLKVKRVDCAESIDEFSILFATALLSGSFKNFFEDPSNPINDCQSELIGMRSIFYHCFLLALVDVGDAAIDVVDIVSSLDLVSSSDAGSGVGSKVGSSSLDNNSLSESLSNLSVTNNSSINNSNRTQTSQTQTLLQQPPPPQQQPNTKIINGLIPLFVDLFCLGVDNPLFKQLIILPVLEACYEILTKLITSAAKASPPPSVPILLLARMSVLLSGLFKNPFIQEQLIPLITSQSKDLRKDVLYTIKTITSTNSNLLGPSESFYSILPTLQERHPHLVEECLPSFTSFLKEEPEWSIPLIRAGLNNESLTIRRRVLETIFLSTSKNPFFLSIEFLSSLDNYQFYYDDFGSLLIEFYSSLVVVGDDFNTFFQTVTESIRNGTVSLFFLKLFLSLPNRELDSSSLLLLLQEWSRNTERFQNKEARLLAKELIGEMILHSCSSSSSSSSSSSFPLDLLGSSMRYYEVSPLLESLPPPDEDIKGLLDSFLRGDDIDLKDFQQPSKSFTTTNAVAIVERPSRLDGLATDLATMYWKDESLFDTILKGINSGSSLVNSFLLLTKIKNVNGGGIDCDLVYSVLNVVEEDLLEKDGKERDLADISTLLNGHSLLITLLAGAQNDDCPKDGLQKHLKELGDRLSGQEMDALITSMLMDYDFGIQKSKLIFVAMVSTVVKSLSVYGAAAGDAAGNSLDAGNSTNVGSSSAMSTKSGNMNPDSNANVSSFYSIGNPSDNSKSDSTLNASTATTIKTATSTRSTATSTKTTTTTKDLISKTLVSFIFELTIKRPPTKEDNEEGKSTIEEVGSMFNMHKWSLLIEIAKDPSNKSLFSEIWLLCCKALSCGAKYHSVCFIFKCMSYLLKWVTCTDDDFSLSLMICDDVSSIPTWSFLYMEGLMSVFLQECFLSSPEQRHNVDALIEYIISNFSTKRRNIIAKMAQLLSFYWIGVTDKTGKCESVNEVQESPTTPTTTSERLAGYEDHFYRLLTLQTYKEVEQDVGIMREGFGDRMEEMEVEEEVMIRVCMNNVLSSLDPSSKEDKDLLIKFWDKLTM